ncbi:MAG: DivIVA domain-containing protein [Acidimicrobiales bacterium]
MAVQHPDPTPGMNPDDIARTTFAMGRKGYDPIEVKTFLVSVSNELRTARSQVLELEQELRVARQEADRNREVDPSRLTALLGEETARVLDAARAVADDMRAKAEEGTSRLLREATDDANRMRQEAAEVLARKTREAEAQADQVRRQADEVLTQAKADAAAEVEAGRQEGREMVAEAQKVRERMLNDLARRRKAFRQQIERLQAGRDRLLAAYDVVRETLDVATDELQVALPEARLAAESASLRAGDEDVATLEELEREAASLPAATAGETAPEPDGGAEAEVETAEPAIEPAAGADVTPEPAEPTAADGAPTADDELVEEPGEPEPQVAPGPRVPSEPEIEGRRSSSVNVIRSETETEAETEAAAEPEPGPEPSSETGETGSAEAPAAAEVSSLFARIRSESEIAADDKAAADKVEAEAAEAEAAKVEVETIELVEEIVVVDGEVVEDAVAIEVTEVDLVVVPEPESGSESEPAEPEAEAEVSLDAQVVARRDAALTDTERSLSRRIKRELSDEQNELLDTVRRQKGKPSAAQALPEADEHRSRYATAALPSLVSAAAIGADLIAGLTDEVASRSGAPKTRGGDLAAELAADLVEGLRDRIERCFAEAAGDDEELAERLRACYREWKGQRVDELAARYAVAACNRGLLDSLAEGTLVHWVVDDGDTPSPDCDDNSLAGDVRKGDKFPTGHIAPPISLTCRCIVLPRL